MPHAGHLQKGQNLKGDTFRCLLGLYNVVTVLAVTFRFISSFASAGAGFSKEIWTVKNIRIVFSNDSLKLTLEITSFILNGPSFLKSSLSLSRFVLMFFRKR